LIANWIINHPKKVSPPTSFLYCRFYHDPNLKGCRHHNFLFVPKKYRPENKWLFWKRKFAFRIKGEAGWYQLPSLTIWEIGEKEIKYGINSLFVLNNIDHDIEYISYLS
jgi:hypothetical protein